MTYTLNSMGGAFDRENRRIYFSFDEFKHGICQNKICFICGKPKGVNFNDEHVFPKWLLKHCGLQQESLNLLNGHKAKYGTYKISCCEKCNSLLGIVYERPISKAICGGYDDLIEFVLDGGNELLQCWLSLIFIKVHLRDFSNKMILDERENTGFIGDFHNLSDLHHIHAVARAGVTNLAIDSKVLGSIAIFKINNKSECKNQIKPRKKNSSDGMNFDYCDSTDSRCMLIQIKDIGIVYVVDDCCTTSHMLSNQLENVPNPISGIQLREIYARYATANLQIKERPVFKTLFPNGINPPRISVDLPELQWDDFNPLLFGQLLADALGDRIKVIEVDGKRGHDALDSILTGDVSFIFNNNEPQSPLNTHSLDLDNQ